MKNDYEEKNPKVDKMSSAPQRHLYKDGYRQCYIRKKTQEVIISPKWLSVWDQLIATLNTIQSLKRMRHIVFICTDMKRCPKHL